MSCSAIKGLALFPSFSMLVLAHENGNLTAMPAPTASNGALGPQQQQQQQQQGGSREGSLAGPLASQGLKMPLASLGGLGGGGLHCWTPHSASIKAHKGGILAVTCWVSNMLLLIIT
jgi:hypothetical protein